MQLLGELLLRLIDDICVDLHVGVVPVFCLDLLQLSLRFIVFIFALPKSTLLDHERLVLQHEVDVGRKNTAHLILEVLDCTSPGHVDWNGWTLEVLGGALYRLLEHVGQFEKFLVWNRIQIEYLEVELDDGLSVFVFNAEALDFIELAVS